MATQPMKSKSRTSARPAPAKPGESQDAIQLLKSDHAEAWSSESSVLLRNWCA